MIPAIQEVNATKTPLPEALSGAIALQKTSTPHTAVKDSQKSAEAKTFDRFLEASCDCV